MTTIGTRIEAAVETIIVVMVLAASFAFCAGALGQPPPPDPGETNTIPDGHSWIAIAWDPSPDPGIAYYRLHAGAEPGNYTWSTNAGLTTNLWVTLPDAVTNYLAATAVGTNQLESDFSNELQVYMFETNGVLVELVESTNGWQSTTWIPRYAFVDPADAEQRWWKLRTTDLSARHWATVE